MEKEVAMAVAVAISLEAVDRSAAEALQEAGDMKQ